MFTRFKLVLIYCQLVTAQINLGSFNLNKGNNGDLLLGFGQGGSLFGFGGDRALQVTIGPGRFGANSNSGLSLGGDRLGVDSIFGIDENRGINLGSFLNSGAQRPFGAQQNTPGGELGQLLNSLMGAFSSNPTRRPTEFGPPPILGGIENKHRQRSRIAQTTQGFVWPTPPPDPPTTTESIFPTLISSWGGEKEEELGSGFMPMGVIDGQGINGNQKPTSHMTTEGKTGPITSQRGKQPETNSGEANKKSGKKSRFGPPPPIGLIPIDSKEEFKRRT